MESRSITEIIRQNLEDIRKEIASGMADKGRNASGRTVHSLQVEASGNGGSVTGLESFRYIEGGRRGGRIPENFTEVIAEWILRKGISVTPIQYVRAGSHRYTPAERGLYSMAGAIAHTIMEKGTRLHRSGRKDDIITSASARGARKLGREVAGIMSLEVEQINRQSNEK